MLSTTPLMGSSRFKVSKALIGAAGAIPATVLALNDNPYGAVVLVLLGGMALVGFLLRR